MSSIKRELEGNSVHVAAARNHIGLHAPASSHPIPNATQRQIQKCQRCDAYKARSRKRAEHGKLLEAELGECHAFIQDIQKRLEVADDRCLSAEERFRRYRGWWLNEYILVKLLLGMIVDHTEVDVIAEASHARFRSYCSDLEVAM